ncbi:hypothetical protein CspHIS471_0108030 [Cutaneotrichosporon sp. HIS471]|nr:hypothetical protein CspHIS471_0108030 [Cutaneotrichosporon sp. HIS471]
MLRRVNTALRVPRLARAASSSPSSKICAVPFRLQPNAAKETMLPMSLMLSGKPGNLMFGLALRFFGSGLEPMGRELGLGTTVELQSIAAAYWPVWRWDMMSEGPWSPAHGGEESPAWMTVREAYIPGNPYAPLSYLSFSIPPLEDDLPVYDAGKDLNQLRDMDIVPVDFTVNPFATIDKLKDVIKRQRNMGGMKVDPDKWKESLLAAYPIYFPIYIAEYVIAGGDNKRSFQLVMDAHSEDTGKCRVSVPNPPEVWLKGAPPKNYFVNPAPLMPTMTLILGSAPAQPFQQSPAEVARINYDQWLSPKPESKDDIRPSPTLSVSRNAKIDWTDPRIQAWNGVEREENGEYIEEAFEVQTNFAAISNMAHASEQIGDATDLKDIDFRLTSWENGKTTTSSGNMSDMKASLEESLAKSTAELAKIKPQWLQELEKGKTDKAESEPDQKDN